ncbi:phosphatase domain-containing protein [Myxococcus qinghaiensis]|uniref:phosphatase domain-containing protein n=1 Tax=Myxococcus qinghaiensis TaxID=2906758 RepID=UPI0020A821AE|nr:tyrosine-protein phosphatase [Myxococcus qinghaiensis]MCP3170105.1 tyrosine-protein phosphatase [Myxococcus qinghaiensis]
MAGLKYSFVFGVFAALLTGLAFQLRGLGWGLLWPALSFALVAVAYAGAGPAVFGKRADGRMQPWALVVLLPYLLMTWTTWRLARRLSRESVHDEVAPGIVIGRRLLAGELPEGTRTVVDLTSEFIEPEGIRSVEHYVCLPILDATAPSVESLASHIESWAALPTPLYIHCAQGHGRTGMVAAAVLIARGVAPDARLALSMVRKARPGVRLSTAQGATLGALESRLLRAERAAARAC